MESLQKLKREDAFSQNQIDDDTKSAYYKSLERQETLALISEYNKKLQKIYISEQRLVWRNLREESRLELKTLYGMKWSEQADNLEHRKTNDSRVVNVDPPLYQRYEEIAKDISLPVERSRDIIPDTRLTSGSFKEEVFATQGKLRDPPESPVDEPHRETEDITSLEVITDAGNFRAFFTPTQNVSLDPVVTTTKTVKGSLEWLLNSENDDTFAIFDTLRESANSYDLLISQMSGTCSEIVPRAMEHLMTSYCQLISKTALRLLLRDQPDDLTRDDLRWHLDLICSTFLLSKSSFCCALSDELFWKGMDFGSLKVVPEEISHFVIQRLERLGLEKEVEEWFEDSTLLSFTQRTDTFSFSNGLRGKL